MLSLLRCAKQRKQPVQMKKSRGNTRAECKLGMTNNILFDLDYLGQLDEVGFALARQPTVAARHVFFFVVGPNQVKTET